MVQPQIAFNFSHIPLNVDKSSIKVFQNVKEAFSLEYAIFEPKSVYLNMYPVPKGWFRKRKEEQGLATIQQFASGMGLHPDFHKTSLTPIDTVLKLLQKRFKVDPEDPDFPTYYCGGLIATKGDKDPPMTNVEFFTDTLLEILTDHPRFALLQFVFKAIKPPKEFRPDTDDPDQQRTQLKFDIHQGKVERRFSSSIYTLMEDMGCFKLSPRVLVVETDPEALKTKLNRISVLFKSNGFKIRRYPTFWRRLSSLKSVCINRKLVSPTILDGFSLMSFIAPPQQQYAHEGYSLVPNKNDYHLSSGLAEVSSQQAINLGVPIISGRTTDVPLLVGGNELSRHMAVFGMTGEGKSRFIYWLLKEFYDKNVKFLIFDPKGEYLQPVQTFCEDFIYLKPGSTDFPWAINLFQIPKDASGEFIIPQEDHIQFVMSILEHFFDESDALSPQMRRLLHLAIIQTVMEQGDFRTFLHWLNSPKRLGIKGVYLENTAAGIMNRIEKLFFGNTGRCFTVSQTTYEISNLLERNVIIDLSAFEAMEDQSGRRIFLEIVLQYLFYFTRKFRAPFKEKGLPKNIFVLDEIQKLVPPSTYRSKVPESMIGKGPWTLRSYDISMIFIGTDPVIDQPILTNTGVLAIFYSKYDPFTMANLLGVSKLEYEQLRGLLKAKQDDRCCIISMNGQVSLLKTNDFSFSLPSSMDQSALQQLPLQKQLQEAYQKFVFDPIGEVLSQE